MKKSIDDFKKSSSKKNPNMSLPEEFEVIDIIVKGKKVLVNMKELLQVSDCSNKLEVTAAMNKASMYYFYFGRVEAELENILNEEKENFDVWLADKKSRFDDEKSESGKERAVMVKYKVEFEEKKQFLRSLELFAKQADIAKKALEKNIIMLQSIGAMIREESKKNIYDIGNIKEE